MSMEEINKQVTMPHAGSRKKAKANGENGSKKKMRFSSTLGENVCFDVEPTTSTDVTIFSQACYYQVDHSYNVASSSSFLGRVSYRYLLRWVFGTSPSTATMNLRGAACRGEEQEIIFYYEPAADSHHTPINKLWINGQRHYGVDREDSRDGKEEYGFRIDPHTIQITVDPPPATERRVPFFRRHDGTTNRSASNHFVLQVDGQLFSFMTKIYQLGMTEHELLDDIRSRSYGNVDGQRTPASPGCFQSMTQRFYGTGVWAFHSARRILNRRRREEDYCTVGYDQVRPQRNVRRLEAEQARLLDIALLRSLLERHQPR